MGVQRADWSESGTDYVTLVTAARWGNLRVVTSGWSLISINSLSGECRERGYGQDKCP